MPGGKFDSTKTTNSYVDLSVLEKIGVQLKKDNTMSEDKIDAKDAATVESKYK